jgi:hypothetical protein
MATVFADNYGFNENNSTKALQNAINDPNADKIIVRNMGKPWLVSEQILIDKSNKEIVFEPGVLVQAKSGSFLDNTVPMFRVRSADNVKLIGQGEGENRATLKMNREEFTFSPDLIDYGHIIEFNGAKDYVASGLRLTGAGGDGIQVAGAAYVNPDPNLRSYSENGLIEDIIADNNRRQGLSIVSAKDLVVRDSTFSGTNGTFPGAGIDLEPTWSFESLQNIKIENVDILNNDGHGILMSVGNLNDQSEPISVEIDNARIDNSNRSGISVEIFNIAEKGANGNKASSMVNGTINVRNTNISKSNGINGEFDGDLSGGIRITSLPGHQDDPNNLKVNFEKVNISDTADSQFAKHPIYIKSFGGESAPQQLGNLSFKDVTIQDNFKRDVIKADMGRPDGYLNNISGNITATNPNGVTSSFDSDNPPQNFSLTVTEGAVPTNLPERDSRLTPVDPVTGNIPLVNPNFDDSLNGWNIWDRDRVTLATRENGDPWAKIDALGGGFGQDVTDDIVAGQNYVVSGTAKISQSGDQSYLGVLFKNAAGENIDFKELAITSETEEFLKLSFTAPEKFASAQVFAWKAPGTSDIFVDNFSLVPQPTI